MPIMLIVDLASRMLSQSPCLLGLYFSYVKTYYFSCLSTWLLSRGYAKNTFDQKRQLKATELSINIISYTSIKTISKTQYDIQ